MKKKSNEPYLWALFSGGGTISAFILPAIILLFGIAIPLGWVDEPSYGEILSLIQLPINKILLFIVITLSLFHWAHRFRFTLYDGLQIKHLNDLIAMTCYGGAIAGTVYSGYLLWTI